MSLAGTHGGIRALFLFFLLFQLGIAQAGDELIPLTYGFKYFCGSLLKESPTAHEVARAILGTSPGSVYEGDSLSELMGALMSQDSPSSNATEFRMIVQRVRAAHRSGQDGQSLVAMAELELAGLAKKMGLEIPAIEADGEPPGISLPEAAKIAASPLAVQLVQVSPRVQAFATRLLASKLKKAGRSFNPRNNDDILDFILELSDRPGMLLVYSDWVRQVKSVSEAFLNEQTAKGRVFSSTDRTALLTNAAEQQWREFFARASGPRKVMGLLTYPGFNPLVHYTKDADETAETPVVRLSQAAPEITANELERFIRSDVQPFARENRAFLMNLLNRHGRKEEVSADEVMIFMDQQNKAIAGMLARLWAKAGNDVDLAARIQQVAKEFALDLPKEVRNDCRPPALPQSQTYGAMEAQWLKSMRLLNGLLRFKRGETRP